MTKSKFKLLDVVALTTDLPEKYLLRGQVGTIVEILKPGVFEVEFVNIEGETYAMTAIREDQLLRLLHQREQAA